MGTDRFSSRFGSAGPAPNQGTSLSKGELLQRLELLIIETQKNLKAFSEGRTVFIGYVRMFRNRAQHCLADIGPLAQEALQELAALDLSISEGLQQYYDGGIFNDFDVKDGDPSEFLRLQREYDQEMPSRIQRIITLLNQVRDKMLGLSQAPDSARLSTSLSQYSQKDDELYQQIGAESFKAMTNAELWKRYRRQLKLRKSDSASFRSRADRIRHYHGFPLSSELTKKSINKSLPK